MHVPLVSCSVLLFFCIREAWCFPGIRLQQSTATSSSVKHSSQVSPTAGEEPQQQYLEALIQRTPDEIPIDTDEEVRQAEYEKQVQLMREQRKITFAVSLAAISGALDVICFQRFGCFAHLMTGNTVKCLTAAADMRWNEVMFYAAMVTFYTAGSAGFRMVDILTSAKTPQENQAQKKIATSSALSLVLLPIFSVSEILSKFLQLPAQTLAFIWAFGFGMVNASTLDATGVVTNAVTGHWHKFGIAAVDSVVLGKPSKASSVTFKVLGSTGLSILLTSFASRFFKARSPYLTAFCPPIGLIIGLAYFTLFRWYGKEPAITKPFS